VIFTPIAVSYHDININMATIFSLSREPIIQCGDHFKGGVIPNMVTGYLSSSKETNKAGQQDYICSLAGQPYVVPRPCRKRQSFFPSHAAWCDSCSSTDHLPLFLWDVGWLWWLPPLLLEFSTTYRIPRFAFPWLQVALFRRRNAPVHK